jgi:Rrf2 family transcriptional regulator, cysteine metabolism repressor
MITQKTQYALRAIYELAKRQGEGPIKISEISRAQVIPARFLEVILHRLKRGGLVGSKRGFGGGYTLLRPPDQITVRDIIHQMDEPVGPVRCVSQQSFKKCPLEGDCAFFPIWSKVRKSVMEIFDSTTIQGLMDGQKDKDEETSGRGSPT